MDESRFAPRELKLRLLQHFAGRQRSENRRNVLGGPGNTGPLEYQLGVEFTAHERSVAHRALRELEDAGLLRATLADAIAPYDWLEVTEAGRWAVERNALDALDEQLAVLGGNLLDVRQGAWAAAHSSQPDTVRQAAHSGRELIRLVLDAVAADEQVKRAAWFKGPEVHRRDRVKFAMERHQGRVSKSTLRVIEAQCAVVEAVYHRLSGLAHAEAPVLRPQVVALLQAAESALRDVLVPPGM